MGKKNPGINPGQRHLKYIETGFTIYSEPTGKGQKKKEKKKNPGINPGQPAGKKAGKKTPGINPGQPA